MNADAARAGQTVTLVGALVNILLVAIKFTAGIYGRSSALMADAVHSLSDLFTDVVVAFGLWRGRRPPDRDHPFGHGRVETMAAAVVGLSLIGAAIYLGVEAVQNIYRPGGQRPSMVALYGAAASIALKEAVYRYTVRVGRRIGSQLLVANAWHHRSDALSSVAVLAGVAGARIRPEWHVLDAYAALLVSFFVIKVGLEILGRTVRELADAAPAPEIVDGFDRCARETPGVLETHDLRVRSSGGRYLVEIHIVVDGGLTVTEGHRIAQEVEACLTVEYGDIDRVIIHVDPSGEGGPPATGPGSGPPGQATG